MTEAKARAVVNVNCLSDRACFTGTPTVHDFDWRNGRKQIIAPQRELDASDDPAVAIG
jgi:hypothetical protein